MGPLGELGALFNPGMRHEIEERKSKANRREEEGNARDGDFRIDLASGVAVINVPGRAGDNSQEPVAQPTGAERVSAADAGELSTERTGDVAGTALPDPSPSRATPLEARSTASPDSQSQKNAASRSAVRASRAAAAAEQQKVAGKSEGARPAPRPSSKASRAAR